MTAFHPAALAEIEHARDWYESRRPGLGAEFVDEVERAVALLEADPTSFARAPESRVARRLLLTRFPYWLVFALLDDGEALIVALAHARRRAGYWRRRVRVRKR
jgi:plasmid stabilization system protein ParE